MINEKEVINKFIEHEEIRQQANIDLLDSVETIMNKCTENIEEIHQNPFFGTFLASAILDFYEMLLRMSAKGNRASTHRILKRMLDKRWLETEEGL